LNGPDNNPKDGIDVSMQSMCTVQVVNMTDFPLSIRQLMQGLKSFMVKCVAVMTDSAQRYLMACLLDLGASDNFIDETWAEQESITLH
jgi:hypothetical protein